MLDSESWEMENTSLPTFWSFRFQRETCLTEIESSPAKNNKQLMNRDDNVGSHCYGADLKGALSLYMVLS